MSPRIKWAGSSVALAAVIGVLISSSGGVPQNPIPPEGGYPTLATTGIPIGADIEVPDLDDDDNYVITVDGSLHENLDVSAGCILIRASNVTIRNVLAQCISNDHPDAIDGARNTIEDSEIDCTGGFFKTGMFYENFTARRVEIRDCENALDMFRNATLEDSYMHDFAQCVTIGCTEPDAHTDGIQSGDGTDLLIKHNTIKPYDLDCGFPPPLAEDGRCNGTGAININNDDGTPYTPTDTLIENNLIGGGAYTMYCPSVATSNYVIKDNHFTTELSPDVGSFGPSADCGSNETKTGNVYHESGLPVTLE